MKIKKLSLVFIIIVVFFINIPNVTHATVCDSDKKLYIYKQSLESIGVSNNSLVIEEVNPKIIKEKLSDFYSYNGKLTEHIKFKTNITIKKYSIGNYEVYLGNSKYKQEIETLDEVKKICALKDGDLKGINVFDTFKWQKATYKVTVVADVLGISNIDDWQETITNSNGSDTVMENNYYIWVKSIYRGESPSDFEQGRELTDEDFQYDNFMERDQDDEESFGKEFLSNPFAAGAKLFLNNVVIPIGDIFQLGADYITGTKSDTRIMFSITDAASLYNDLLNVKMTTSTNSQNAESSSDSTETTSDTDGEDTTSTTDSTETTSSSGGTGTSSSEKTYKLMVTMEDLPDNAQIPVISADIFNLAVGNNDFFSINFLESDTENGNEYWGTIRNFFTAIIHVLYYIISALLITKLIIYGIKVVKESTSPVKKAKYKEGINKLCISIAMLFGMIVIMAISIYASEAFITDVLGSDDGELPIRVTSRCYEYRYEFNTNFTGYVRFMCQVAHIDDVPVKAAFSFTYLILAIINLVGAIFMCVRMIGAMVAAAVGAFTVMLYAIFEKENAKIVYKKIIIFFAVLSMVQVIFAIISALMIKCLSTGI